MCVSGVSGVFSFFFFFNDPAPTGIYTLSLHAALPIYSFCYNKSSTHLISYALIDSIRLSATNVDDNAGGGLKEFIRLSGSNPEMWSEIFELNGMNIIKSLAGMQLSINNLLELITKNKEIPSMFSHSEMLKNELEEIKNYKEDKF